MKSLYVLGGKQGSPSPARVGLNGWYKYDAGLAFWVNPETGEAELRATHVSPPDARRGGDPAILFKCSSVSGDRLYACTETEILIYSLPRFELLTYLSLPSFNNLHHVRPTERGTLLLCNTGLDMVMELTDDGQVLNEWSAVPGEAPWTRFSRELDYRKVTESGGICHPNYVFPLADELWVTRFKQRDAICVTRHGPRIDIEVGIPHDGVVHDGKVYFTIVDGRLAIADPETLKVVEVVDLHSMHVRQRLGWCRGLLFDGDRLWVGFSRTRPTKIRENVAWVKHGFKQQTPTHLACYDLARRKCLAEIDLERFGLGSVFSVLAGPEVGSGLTSTLKNRGIPLAFGGR